MASYRYERDIDPADLVPEAPRQYTRREKWKNWWDYNLKWVILAVVCVLALVLFLGQATSNTTPDYNVALVSPYAPTEETVTALQEQLARYGTDLNGDGKVTVTVNTYIIDYSDDKAEDYLDIATATKLAVEFSTGTSSVFILYDPAGFEQSTSALRYLDGTLPELDNDSDWWNMVYRWTDCPVLAGLDVDADFSDYYVGVRGVWDEDIAKALAGSDEFWQALTAGAVSTVEAEG